MERGIRYLSVNNENLALNEIPSNSTITEINREVPNEEGDTNSLSML